MTDSNSLPARQDDSAAVANLVSLLDVEALETDLYRGKASGAGWARVFGGQVVAQALMAASKTVQDRLAHSLHCYFLRAGDPKVPIVYRVERDRDGQSFTSRRVVAIQHGRPIFNMAASFQVEEAGLSHAVAMPVVALPETLPTEYESFLRIAERMGEKYRTSWLSRERPFEFRSAEGQDWSRPQKSPPVSHNWFKPAAPIVADAVLARCLLAYASDMTLLDTALLPHGLAWNDPALQVASLDHSLYFHGTPPLDDWLLYAQDSPIAVGGRGLNRGLIFARDGQLVASAIQEGLIRYRPAT